MSQGTHDNAVLEYPDRVEFIGQGFFEGAPNDYAANGHTPDSCRNVALARTITNLSMIDPLEHGIERTSRSQAHRYLSIPSTTCRYVCINVSTRENPQVIAVWSGTSYVLSPAVLRVTVA